MPFLPLPKLHPGDKVAIVSPSFAAPGKWPHVYELGRQRLKEIFQLEPVEFPATAKLGASAAERASDLVAAFEDKTIRAVIASLGGNDQVTYIKNLPPEPFVNNPKPFFGFSDNTHFENFLWLHGIPSYYGASLFTQFAMQGRMDPYTIGYLKHALFDEGEFELAPSDTFNEMGLDWNDPANLTKERVYEKNDGWYWDAGASGSAASSAPGTTSGITWGGCVESIDELLRHGIAIPSLADFGNIVLLAETSEEVPSPDYVFRVFRALGERGILARVKAVIVGRPKAWEFNHQATPDERRAYREAMREIVLRVVRTYNKTIPVIQNFNIGHTDPQIAMPYGRTVRIDTAARKVFAEF
ncbi:MAG TPA: S66 peptidase family protein [Candidatus Paceibacterota bacterium]|nr:S66 peptidase family protein [Candidatus Paceibacterota bacterium]